VSTPRTLVRPGGVESTEITTSRGTFAALVTRGGTAGHLLLIPGWTGSKEDFTPLLPLLAEAGYEATAYDQRGQYETPGDPAPDERDADYSLAGFAADAVAIAAASTSAPGHLLGHSFGGLVAQQAVVDSAGSWRSASLLCTGPGALGQAPDRPLDRLIEALEGGVPMPEIVRRLKGDLAEESPKIEAFVQKKFALTSRASLAAMTRQLIETPDLTDQVAATGLRCWVGRGVDDVSWAHERQAQQAERLGTHLVEIPGAAHSPAIENPQGLAETLLPFLDS